MSAFDFVTGAPIPRPPRTGVHLVFINPPPSHNNVPPREHEPLYAANMRPPMSTVLSHSATSVVPLSSLGMAGNSSMQDLNAAKAGLYHSRSTSSLSSFVAGSQNATATSSSSHGANSAAAAAVNQSSKAREISFTGDMVFEVPSGPQVVQPGYSYYASRLTPFYSPMDLQDRTLIFESRFESGNLMRAVKVSPLEYNLEMRPDYGTVNCTQWFYFCVRNTTAGMRVRMNIINFQKRASLFTQGQRVLVYSDAEAAKKGYGWHRAGENISYFQTPGTKRSDQKQTLSFTYVFQHSQDVVYFAFSYPYTYTDLQTFLDKLEQFRFVRRKILCKTIAGNNVDVLTISSFEDRNMNEKKGVVITARVHPGETISSFMAHGMIQYLISSDPVAKSLRSLYVFKIVPMLNPDGVVCGNTRCNILGYDLNRQYSQPRKRLATTCPTVAALKDLIAQFQTEREVVMYCDLHGHSRKLNTFIYGCDNDPNSSIHFHERVFPRILADVSDLFSFESSSFVVQKSKESCARVVIRRKRHIVASYTLEGSLCGSSQGACANCHYSVSEMVRSGRDFCRALYIFASPEKRAEYLQRVKEDIAANPSLNLTDAIGSDDDEEPPPPPSAEKESGTKPTLLDANKKSKAKEKPKKKRTSSFNLAPQSPVSSSSFSAFPPLASIAPVPPAVAEEAPLVSSPLPTLLSPTGADSRMDAKSEASEDQEGGATESESESAELPVESESNSGAADRMYLDDGGADADSESDEQGMQRQQSDGTLHAEDFDEEVENDLLSAEDVREGDVVADANDEWYAEDQAVLAIGPIAGDEEALPSRASLDEAFLEEMSAASMSVDVEGPDSMIAASPLSSAAAIPTRSTQWHTSRLHETGPLPMQDVRKRTSLALPRSMGFSVPKPPPLALPGQHHNASLPNSPGGAQANSGALTAEPSPFSFASQSPTASPVVPTAIPATIPASTSHNHLVSLSSLVTSPSGVVVGSSIKSPSKSSVSPISPIMLTGFGSKTALPGTSGNREPIAPGPFSSISPHSLPPNASESNLSSSPLPIPVPALDPAKISLISAWLQESNMLDGLSPRLSDGCNNGPSMQTGSLNSKSQSLHRKSLPAVGSATASTPSTVAGAVTPSSTGTPSNLTAQLAFRSFQSAIPGSFASSGPKSSRPHLRPRVHPTAIPLDARDPRLAQAESSFVRTFFSRETTEHGDPKALKRSASKPVQKKSSGLVTGSSILPPANSVPNPSAFPSTPAATTPPVAPSAYAAYPRPHTSNSTQMATRPFRLSADETLSTATGTAAAKEPSFLVSKPPVSTLLSYTAKPSPSCLGPSFGVTSTAGVVAVSPVSIAALMSVAASGPTSASGPGTGSGGPVLLAAPSQLSESSISRVQAIRMVRATKQSRSPPQPRPKS
eukprot:ANDGO_06994.mRNA.1 Cytosolic carboxypeptidase NnaD